ncbi:hypothetical protein [Pseudomonas matsuisoli]|nr:hypothetical protein [Pseudomonas matsuisoli]
MQPMNQTPDTSKDEEPDVTMTDARESETDLDPDDELDTSRDDR